MAAVEHVHPAPGPSHMVCPDQQEPVSWPTRRFRDVEHDGYEPSVHAATIGDFVRDVLPPMGPGGVQRGTAGPVHRRHIATLGGGSQHPVGGRLSAPSANLQAGECSSHAPGPPAEARRTTALLGLRSSLENVQGVASLGESQPQRVDFSTGGLQETGSVKAREAPRVVLHRGPRGEERSELVPTQMRRQALGLERVRRDGRGLLQQRGEQRRAWQEVVWCEVFRLVSHAR